CNKLYESDKVTTKRTGQILICLNCNFVKYSNHPISKQRQLCNQQLAKEKNFKNQDEDFFMPEHANTHLGLMINLDWFSPFQNLVYSTGAIYAVICNLP
ncbi:27744_t:CDS:2, partial [Dentiscutata erythropus]